MKTDWLLLFRDRKKTAVFLALVFLVSVLVRMPYLGRPLSSHHEWLTSTSLIHIQCFYDEGFTKLYFSPCMSYANAADKNINFHANLKDKNGNMFYLSFPPFAFLLPAFVFSAVRMPPTVLGLQCFNLFFHFIGCLFVYLILLRITGGWKENGSGLPAALGFLIYLFSPATLWFQSNVYMSDMFVQVFFILGVWLFLRLRDGEKRRWPYLLLYGINLFFFVYTEWLGIFFAATAFLMVLFDMKKKGSWPFLFVTAACVIAPLALTLWQYSLISGFPDMLEYMRKKFLYRTGDPRFAFGSVSFLSPNAWANILVNYIGGFLPALVLIVYTAVRLAGKKAPKGTAKPRWDAQERSAVLISLFPVLIHNLVFFNFTSIHDFSALKGGVFIAIIAGLLYDKALKRSGPGKPDWKKTAAFGLPLLALSLLMYYVINGVGSTDRFKKIGEAIRDNSRPDEVVFFQGVSLPPEPQIIVYAHRNFTPWYGREEAEKMVRQNGVRKGVLITFAQDQRTVASVERFELKDK